MAPPRPVLAGDFDVIALWEVVDAQREARSMSWGQLNKAMAWMSKPTMERMWQTGTSTCNHVLPFIQWVGRTPESFTVEPDGAVHELLPSPDGPGAGWSGERSGRWRWWWNARDLAAEVDDRRQTREMTWKEVADEIGCPMEGLQKTKYGPPIGVAMMAARWLQRSAASFMTETPPALLNSRPVV